MGEPDKNVCNCDQALAAEAEVRRLKAELAAQADYRARYVTAMENGLRFVLQLSELRDALRQAEKPTGGYAQTPRLVQALAAVTLRDGS